MPSARILIITSGHPCRNPRPVKEATTLAQAGYDVTLLHVRNHPPSLAADAALLKNAPYRTQAIDLLNKTLGGRLRSWRLRSATKISRSLNQFGLYLPQSLGVALPLLAAAKKFPGDLTIVHNEAPHWVGTKLLALNRRVAADIEDWHSEDLLPHDRLKRPLGLLRRVEKTLLHSAAYTSTTSQALADALHERYGGLRPVTITNSFPLQRLTERPPNDPPAFFWFSQTLGPGRGLDEFISAWGKTHHPSRLVLLGTPSPGYVGQLLDLLPPERRTTVSFLPLVTPEDLPALIARHDIGLALEQSTILSRDLTITNKILQYLNAGLGIVATPTTGQCEVLKHASNAGLLVNLHQTEAVTRQLDELLGDSARLQSMRDHARAAAEHQYSWEREAPKLLALVESALATRPLRL